MGSTLRKLRAAVSLSALWAGVWAVTGGIIGISYLSRAPHMPGYPRDGAPIATNIDAILAIAFNMGTYGAVTGACFALLLAWSSKRRAVCDISAARMAAIGAVAGSSWIAVDIAVTLIEHQRSGLPVAGMVSIALNAILGAGAGWATWWINRRTVNKGQTIPQHTQPELLGSEREVNGQRQRKRVPVGQQGQNMHVAASR